MVNVVVLDRKDTALVGNSTARVAAAAAIATTTYFAMAAVATHIVSTHYDLVRDYISDYAVGPWGWIYGSAFLASFVGCFALAVALWALLPVRVRPRAGLILLMVVGVTYAVDFVFPTDVLAPGEPPKTLVGEIHLADVLGWVLFVANAFLVLRGVRKDHRFDTVRLALTFLSWFAPVTLAALVAAVVAKLPIGGLIEKTFILDRNVWALLLAIVAFRVAAAPSDLQPALSQIDPRASWKRRASQCMAYHKRPLGASILHR
jgi:hypothetical protein